jgi:hypothetical protein
MTNALFSPRSEEIHWSEIGEILTLNGQGRTIKVWTAEMALANDRARRFQASEARRLQDAWGRCSLALSFFTAFMAARSLTAYFKQK